MIGLITGPARGRSHARQSGGSMLAVQNGADLIRVHDVQESADVLRMLEAYHADKPFERVEFSWFAGFIEAPLSSFLIDTSDPLVLIPNQLTGSEKRA